MRAYKIYCDNMVNVMVASPTSLTCVNLLVPGEVAGVVEGFTAQFARVDLLGSRSGGGRLLEVGGCCGRGRKRRGWRRGSRRRGGTRW